MRVIFIVRCHGEPNETIEEEIMKNLITAVERPEAGWGILTIGRQYFHDTFLCDGHPDAKDQCGIPSADEYRWSPNPTETTISNDPAEMLQKHWQHIMLVRLEGSDE